MASNKGDGQTCSERRRDEPLLEAPKSGMNYEDDARKAEGAELGLDVAKHNKEGNHGDEGSSQI
jgi:hypothetical protein